MEYYIIKDSLDPKIVGSDYPQAYSFIKGYNPEAPDGIYTLSKHQASFPNFELNLDGIKLSGKAKQTDFVSEGFGLGRIISYESMRLLSSHTLCMHRFHPMSLYIRNVKHDYFLFNIKSDYMDFVDYKKSTFVYYNLLSSQQSDVILIESKKEYIAKRTIMKEEQGFEWSIRGNSILMCQNFNRELDYFRIGTIDANTYISRRLMDAIIVNNLTGLEFIPATNLFV